MNQSYLRVEVGGVGLSMLAHVTLSISHITLRYDWFIQYVQDKQGGVLQGTKDIIDKSTQ